MESMEIDDMNEINESMPRGSVNGFKLFPVSPHSSGEGLPYAPVDFPEPGDIWRWKVGSRVSLSGHCLHRYLYLPRRFGKLQDPTRTRSGFASKLSIKRYLQNAYPNVDISSFFASFSWRIPSKSTNATKTFKLEHHEETGHPMMNAQSDGIISCKAGNEKCASLLPAVAENPLFSCEICCSESQFCRDCCCILCSKTISLDYGGYGYIKCEVSGNDGYACGHIAHLNCALQSYVAGTIGGSVGLDAAYYCRRCDSRTDLIPHVRKLFGTCREVDSRDDIDKILRVGISILRGSERTSAIELLNSIESVLTKLKSGICVGDIWKVEENTSAICIGMPLRTLGYPGDGDMTGSPVDSTTSSGGDRVSWMRSIEGDDSGQYDCGSPLTPGTESLPPCTMPLVNLDPAFMPPQHSAGLGSSQGSWFALPSGSATPVHPCRGNGGTCSSRPNTFSHYGRGLQKIKLDEEDIPERRFFIRLDDRGYWELPFPNFACRMHRPSDVSGERGAIVTLHFNARALKKKKKKKRKKKKTF